MKQYHSKHTAVLSTRGFYTILTVCALIIAASAWVLWSDATAPAEDETQASLPIVTPAESLPDLSEDTPVLSEETGDADEPDADQEPDGAAPEQADDTAAETAPAPVETVSAPIYVRPVAGAVITPFSGDELLFQPTFGDWRVHTGTDFAAEAGETVLALTDGTVQQVVEDGLYGTCVTLSHDADLTSTYCGITDVRVAEGQAVAAGEAIGTVAETIDAEAALGPHLHVEAARAGTPVDVLELLGESEIE
ncbi:M23 family metallopeptidase [Agathobaculum sp. Marseille-P7918]|uniref:M23 family metallopeptidase n=1 Tax=Agathobaculum sp. Marseille-P7918 TaxID=2479843 RepID=UPI000F63F8F5|nr:M23 family metallopeptidase [Agathobaculum sp. Marseille-P7918]